MTAILNAPEFVLPDLAAIVQEAETVDVGAVLEAETGQHLPWTPSAIALALFRDQSLTTKELVARAEARCARREPQLKTFVPLYTTNHCDSECKMCSMRGKNTRLDRQFASRSQILEQLEILRHEEGVRGIGLLTGEYDSAYTRLATAFRVGWIAREALDRGFEDIYVNIGSMTPEEIEVFADWVPDRKDAVTLCVFQESYDRETYRRFMGDTSENVPKANFDRRITSFDRWLDAGFPRTNPGVLMGLHTSVEEELVYLTSHVGHLRDRGSVVDISIPRMRPARTTRNTTRVGDEDYVRLTAVLSHTFPENRLVLTNREPKEIRDQVIGMSGIISPGSPDVAPYARDGSVKNSEGSSQFIVAELARPRDILADVEASGRRIANFGPTIPVRSGEEAAV
ncbi:3-methyl-2-indolic acid synthase [Kocuria indica]|uniref:3-methyl-2-indolic acid synthase n=1 Tax=Kocuria marina TaxID=223184 RepID=UPI001EF70D4D|nr:3-methyl-2-indolic acid synthase [Kocuria indica]MCG7431221.1 3-methyl-2-indolic acid synthase [Kocuria indica]